VSGSAFAAGRPIPRRYSCAGEDLSPPLAWRAVPANAVSLALIADDPDAPVGTFTHRLAWGISPDDGDLRTPGEGRNDVRAIGYRGPCPPRGHGRTGTSFPSRCHASHPMRTHVLIGGYGSGITEYNRQRPWVVLSSDDRAVGRPRVLRLGPRPLVCAVPERRPRPVGAVRALGRRSPGRHPRAASGTQPAPRGGSFRGGPFPRPWGRCRHGLALA